MKTGCFQLLVDGVLEVREAYDSTKEIAKKYGISQWDVYHIFRHFHLLTGYPYRDLLYQPRSNMWTSDKEDSETNSTGKKKHYTYDVVQFSLELAKSGLTRKSIESSLMVSELLEGAINEMLRRDV